MMNATKQYKVVYLTRLRRDFGDDDKPTVQACETEQEARHFIKYELPGIGKRNSGLAFVTLYFSDGREPEYILEESVQGYEDAHRGAML